MCYLYMANIRIYKYNRSKKKDVDRDLLKSGKAADICRNVITLSYIDEIFSFDNIEGFYAKKDGKYVGFILYQAVSGEKGEEDYAYLDIVCTKGGNKGLGIKLINKMEQAVKKEGLYIIKAEAIDTALPFYRRNGWELDERLKNRRGELQHIVKFLGKARKTKVTWKDLDKREFDVLKTLEDREIKKKKSKQRKKKQRKKKKKEETFFESMISYLTL